MDYELLIAENQEVKVDTYPFTSDKLKGLYMDGNIALSDKLDTTNEKTCILAEELGHHYTTTGNILDQSNSNNRKQEQIARMWAYKKLVPLESIIDAFEHHCTNRYEVADFLGVTEEFLIDTINAYMHKYGYFLRYREYIIEFSEDSVGIIKNI